jgi:alkylated DNA repair dioxygenase AlkB
MTKQDTTQQLFELHGKLYTPQQCKELLERLHKEIDWQREYFAFGRQFDVPRLQSWYADEGVHYRYGDNMLQSHSWIPLLLQIKQAVEERSRHRFNSVLVTYYRDGHDHVTWHADDEPELGPQPVIASLSLGASREFHYRHKSRDETGSLELHDGELLIMQAEFQQYWEHAIISEPEVVEPRINLTFREVVLARE